MIFLLAIVSFSPCAIAYPQDQLNECMRSAKENPNIKDLSEQAIEDFCDCSLQEIVDKGRDAISSANQCAKKSFR